MVQTVAISEKTTLKYLRQNFNLQRIEDHSFFPEWNENLPDITDAEQSFLDRVKNRYFHQLDEGMMLENGVKMMIVSPLLEAAGFYDAPFRTRFEPTVQIPIDIGTEILQGRIDALVVQEQFWIWVLEAKRTTFSLGMGIPQALAYMLGDSHPDQPTFGLLCGGDSFIFIKLSQQEPPIYALSKHFSILNDGDLYTVLQVLRKMGRLAL
ncbi:MAG: type I restriction endonuclease subunit R [Cyanothece sp. SIO1E1]|nr:type I restriction endonuclease subunit R [Cyanothece sp. SIO1E1]